LQKRLEPHRILGRQQTSIVETARHKIFHSMSGWYIMFSLTLPRQAATSTESPAPPALPRSAGSRHKSDIGTKLT